MKRLQLKKLITCSLIMTTITSTISFTTKAESLSDVYKQAYNSTMNVVEIGKEFNVIPRHSDNNTNINSNTIETIYKAVKNGNMQKAINHARECIEKLPKDQWQAKNTFSNILDGYQQPSYEHIVDMVLKLDKLTQKYENEFKYSSDWNETKKNQFCDAISQLQSFIEMARVLNNGVDPAYGNAYSSALDKPQQRVINMINSVVNQAKKTQNINDINFSERVLEVFKENISSNSNIKDYINQLQSYVYSLKTLSELKSKLDSMDKEIASLKDDKNNFKDAINEINNKIKNLENQSGSSTTIIQVPEALKNAVKNNTNAIKELQNKVDDLSDKLGKPTFNPDRNQELLKLANTALNNFNTTPNNDTLNEVQSNVSKFLNYNFTENKNDHKAIYQKMYTIANPIVEKAIKDENLDNLNLIRDFLLVAINAPSYNACSDANYDIRGLLDKVVDKINELEMHKGYEARLNEISDSIKNIQNVSDAQNICYKLRGFKHENLSQKTIDHLNEVTNEFFSYLKKYESNADTSEKQNNFLNLADNFLDCLREDSTCITNTEELVIKFYTDGIDELKTQTQMNEAMVRVYVYSITYPYFKFKDNKNIEDTCLNLVKELGDVIITQISEGKFTNETVIDDMINNLKQADKVSPRYKLGDNLQNSLYTQKLNSISELINHIKNRDDARLICNKLGEFKNISYLNNDIIAKLNTVTSKFFNYLENFESKANTVSEKEDFLVISSSFLNCLRKDNTSMINKTETLVIDYYTKGINELKTQSSMNYDMIQSYVNPILHYSYFSDNANINNKCLSLIEELGNSIINQISNNNNFTNESTINDIIRVFKQSSPSSERYIIGERLQKSFYEQKLNTLSKLIKGIKTQKDAEFICSKLRNFKDVSDLSPDVDTLLNQVNEEFYNYLTKLKLETNDFDKKLVFVNVSSNFLNSLRENNPLIAKTTDLVIEYYNEGFKELKSQPTMEYNFIYAYVDTIINPHYFGSNEKIENTGLGLIEDLGNTIIEQISNGNPNNEFRLDQIIRQLKADEFSTSKRYLLGEKLQKELDAIKNTASKTKNISPKSTQKITNKN